MESYKKWIVAAIIAVVAGVVTVSVITSPSNKRGPIETARENQQTVPAGPWMETDVKKKLESMPDDPAALARLGDEYFEKNMYAQAIEIYEKTLQLNPNDVDTYNDIGLAYFYAGNVNSAIENLRKGTEVVPSYQRIWLSLGYILLSIERTNEARSALIKAMELAPESIVGVEAKRMLDTI